jgi:magnesium-transporting ATPase (P-type)
VSIFKCCTTGDLFKTDLHIRKSAEKGYRTLALAYKTVSEKDYGEMDSRIKSAFSNLSQRNQLLSEIYEEIDSNLTLIGATAV